MRTICLIIFFIIISFSGFSQEGDSYVFGDSTPNNSKNSNGGFSWARTTAGGNFYASFGTNSYFLIAPTFGYHLTDNVLVGVGVNYAYEKAQTVLYPYTSTTFGGSIYSQYIFSELPILFHVELESINIKVDFSDNIENLTLNLINPYVGGGLKQQIGDYSYIYGIVLWNLNETKESNYIQQNPTIRIGISIGL
ncbi:MAG: hypothetical protein JKY30_00680 [Flavobacteriales bacterium]|nr:hypothetical protein [Flavobacteriales bacterium]